MNRHLRFTGIVLIALVIVCGQNNSWRLVAQEAESETKAESKAESKPETEATGEQESSESTLDKLIEAGHSFHGEAFNEGPRQKAYLMGNTGDVQFKITTANPEAQAFFNQGIGQLHGFWDLEAERSFRHVASLDEDCAMAYWGAAIATIRNDKRSSGFIAEAVKRRDKVSKREQQYIDALNKYITEKKKDKKDRAADYLKDLETIVLDFPDDIEAKAMVVHRIWQNGREGIPVASYVATDALLKDIFAKAPLHPAHHYSIHLWDYRKPEMAVESAERCGAAAPSIAHMWHMPGHIYSRLKQYEKAVYQQEASARVDHNHMMRDRVMPDEIFNFAHNNEWLIRNLIFVGRVHDAIDLATNMIQLPQHPKYNTLEKNGGSASYGRRRILQVLREYEMYDQAIALCDSAYMKVTDHSEEVKRLRLLGCAAAITDKVEIADRARSNLQSILDQDQAEMDLLNKKVGLLKLALDKSADRPPQPKAAFDSIDLTTADEDLKKAKSAASKLKQLVNQTEKALLAVKGYGLAAEGDYKQAHLDLKKATGEDVCWLGELQMLAGDDEAGLKTLRDQVKRRPAEVLPLARLAFFEHQVGEVETARKTFEQLRSTSVSMDLDVPVFARLEAVAEEFGYEANWMKHSVLATDDTLRPELDSLGPFRWSPPSAPSWELTDGDGNRVASNEFDGRPKILIFYLGHGCLHCAEQLSAFGPRVPDFQAAGIDILAISSDGSEKLGESIRTYGSELPFQRLLSDAGLDVFKKFRAFDDFEQQPLHGTFLIDAKGRIRWQDISYEPFMDHEFLLIEAQRLLGQPEHDPLAKQQAQKIKP